MLFFPHPDKIRDNTDLPLAELERQFVRMAPLVVADGQGKIVLGGFEWDVIARALTFYKENRYNVGGG